MIFNKNITTISEVDLHSLIENKIAENKQLDYKVDLPGNAEKDKKEFLADVCSFANTNGGIIIYGVEEEEGIAKSIKGLKRENMDQVILRLENILRDCVSPRIPGIQFSPISLVNGQKCLLVKIPMSWVSPHMVTYNMSSKFFGRNSNGKYQFDVDEIRNSFLSSENLSNKLFKFREERISKIIYGETPLIMGDGPKFVIQYVPVSTIQQKTLIDLNSIESEYNKLRPLNSSVSYTRYNIDGFLTYTQYHTGEIVAYSQLFRNGIIETVNETLFTIDESSHRIPGEKFEIEIIKHSKQTLSFQNQLGFEPPIYVFITLVNVAGLTIGLKWNSEYKYIPEINKKFDRYSLHIPEVEIQSFDNLDLSRTLKPAFDTIWNAAGFPCSQNYDQNGNRVNN